MVGERFAVDAVAARIIEGGNAAPPPNANIGATMYVVRNSGIVSIWLGDATVTDGTQFELPAGEAFTVGPVGPGDELWAAASGATTVDVLRHDTN